MGNLHPIFETIRKMHSGMVRSTPCRQIVEARMRDRIETERLVLRQLTLEDAPAFSRYANDFDISRMTGSIPHPFPLLSAEFKIMYMLSQKRRALAFPYAVTIDGGDMIGIADLFRRSPHATLEIGYWMGKPFWGTGYMTETCQALMDEARNTLGVKALVAGVFADNPASIRVLEKLGFKLTGKSEPYFSNARLKKAESLDLRIDFETSSRAVPLRQSQKMAIRA